MTDIAADLCLAAVRIARRLQALPSGQGCGILYALVLIKGPGDEWKLTVLNDPGRKVEIAST